MAEFIYYDLTADDIRLENAVCQNIVDEAVALVQEGKTNLLEHFTKHPDPEVSNMASKLGEDDYKLSESLKLKLEEERLRAQVEHILLDYRMNMVLIRGDALRKKMLVATTDEERKEVMEETKRLQDMRSEIAKRTGKSIIT